jgi:helix-turn-helix protein
VSIQAVNWAIEQTAGGTRAKAVLWSICNYANHDWLAWPSQRTISEESEQSPDSVQRQLPELEKRGIIRRIPLMYAGRKNVDFIILSQSPYFRATLAEIEPLLPKGYVVDRRYVAAGCGSVDSDSAKVPNSLAGTDACDAPSADKTDVAAGCGNVPTLPQLAADATADAAATGGSRYRNAAVTEPNLTLESEIGSRAREPLICDEAFKISDECLRALSIDPRNPTPDWCGLPYQIQILLMRGCDRMSIVATFARLSGQTPLKPMSYFVKAVEGEQSRPKTPIKSGESHHAQTNAGDHSGDWRSRRDDKHDALAELSDSIDRRRERAAVGDGGGGTPLRLVSDV